MNGQDETRRAPGRPRGHSAFVLMGLGCARGMMRGGLVRFPLPTLRHPRNEYQ